MTIHSSSHSLPSSVPISFPSDKCCNCGSTSDISKVVTELKRAKFMVVAGTELTLKPSLPYCPSCTQTARRQPVGVGSKLLISCLVLFALMIPMAFVPSSVSSIVPSSLILPSLFLLSCVLVFGFYSLRRPTDRQTSYYQPVRLKKVKQKFSGEIVGYIFAFKNSEYASTFIDANKEAIDKEAIKVVAA